MPLRRIRLELARHPDFPEGSAQHGYEFVAPLDEEGLLDLEEWKRNRQACVVHRFWPGEGEADGHLVHRGTRWAFHYEEAEEELEDEPIFKFDRHVFKEGEYVSITEHDGVQRTFRIVSIA